jgi:hypothetical protein
LHRIIGCFRGKPDIIAKAAATDSLASDPNVTPLENVATANCSVRLNLLAEVAHTQSRDRCFYHLRSHNLVEHHPCLASDRGECRAELVVQS